MTLNEHYKFHSRKSLKPYTSLLLLIVLCFGVFHTFAKYTSTANTNSIINVAKWNVLINGQQILSGTNALSRLY